MHPLTDALMDDPIIAAVKNEESLAAALESERETIFLLSSTLLNVRDIVARIHAAGKRAIVHIDLVEGLSSRTIAVDALVAACGPDGIISTHPNLIRHAHTLGLLTIQRAFVLDSLSLDTLFSQQSLGQREEQLRTLQAIGDSLAGLINRGADQQGSLLLNWQQNAFEQNRALEGRQARMHQLTEENLGKFEQRMRAVDQTLDAKLTQNETRVERLRETVEDIIKNVRT